MRPMMIRGISAPAPDYRDHQRVWSPQRSIWGQGRSFDDLYAGQDSRPRCRCTGTADTQHYGRGNWHQSAPGRHRRCTVRHAAADSNSSLLVERADCTSKQGDIFPEDLRETWALGSPRLAMLSGLPAAPASPAGASADLLQDRCGGPRPVLFNLEVLPAGDLPVRFSVPAVAATPGLTCGRVPVDTTERYDMRSVVDLAQLATDPPAPGSRG